MQLKKQAAGKEELYHVTFQVAIWLAGWSHLSGRTPPQVTSFLYCSHLLSCQLWSTRMKIPPLVSLMVPSRVSVTCLQSQFANEQNSSISMSWVRNLPWETTAILLSGLEFRNSLNSSTLCSSWKVCFVSHLVLGFWNYAINANWWMNSFKFFEFLSA